MTLLKLLFLTAFCCFTFQFAFSQDFVTGTVQNDKGTAIAGASVKLKNSKKETSTNDKGNFSLQAKAGESIIITAIGFADTIIAIGQTPLLINLRPEVKILNPVTVNANKQTSPANIAHEQIIQDMFKEFMANQFSFANYHGLQLPNAASGLPIGDQSKILTGHSMSSMYRGEAFPVFHTKEDTKGSTYMFTNWLKGLVADTAGNLIEDTSLFFNYNKITGELISTKDFQSAMYSNNQTIVVFAVSNSDKTTHVFATIPAIDKTHFSEVLTMGNNVGIFKLTLTKFVKSDYHSDGITSSGNNYDEYVDNNTYYLFNIKDNTLTKFGLKKKDIRQAFENIATANDFFSQHKNDIIDDTFLTGLGNNINNQSN